MCKEKKIIKLVSMPNIPPKNYFQEQESNYHQIDLTATDYSYFHTPVLCEAQI